jgi:DNA-binding NtrC family response regulator
MIGNCLLVTAVQNPLPVQNDLEERGFRVWLAKDCREAGKILQANPSLRLALTDSTLPDGTWCNVLGQILEHRQQADLLVSARGSGAELWSEVEKLGSAWRLEFPHRWKDLGTILENKLPPQRAFRSLPQNPAEALRSAGRSAGEVGQPDGVEYRVEVA